MFAGLSDILGIDRMTYFYSRDSPGGQRIMKWKGTPAGRDGHFLGDESDEEEEL